MKILILPDDQYLIESKTAPIVGRHYSLEDAVSGTAQQNKAFHSLITEYYKSGMHSYDNVDLVEFKKLIKKNLGAGFESFVYVEMDESYPIIRDCKTYEEIPLSIRKNYRMKSMIRGKLKSWADYTKRQRQKTMDNLISEMQQVGVNTKHFMEILEGMEDNND